MKRYAVFSGNDYCPRGGWSDYRSSHDAQVEAEHAAQQGHSPDWWQVVDLTTGQVVKEGRRW